MSSFMWHIINIGRDLSAMGNLFWLRICTPIPVLRYSISSWSARQSSSLWLYVIVTKLLHWALSSVQNFLHILFCFQRIEVEPVGFKVISLSCMRDLLVACGNHQFIMMRFKANGDVEDKRTVDIKPSVLKGSIVKVCPRPSLNASVNVHMQWVARLFG